MNYTNDSLPLGEKAVLCNTWHLPMSHDERVCDGEVGKMEERKGGTYIPKRQRREEQIIVQRDQRDSFLLFLSNVYFYLFFTFFCLGRLQGWRADMEGLGNKWDLGTFCEIPNDSIKKLCLKNRSSLYVNLEPNIHYICKAVF